MPRGGAPWRTPPAPKPPEPTRPGASRAGENQAGWGEGRQVASAEQDGTNSIRRRVYAGCVPRLRVRRHRDRVRRPRGNSVGHRLGREPLPTCGAGAVQRRMPGDRPHAMRRPACPASAGRRAFRRPPEPPHGRKPDVSGPSRDVPPMTEHARAVQRSGARPRRHPLLFFWAVCLRQGS